MLLGTSMSLSLGAAVQRNQWCGYCAFGVNHALPI